MEIVVIHEDITVLEVDAVVNPATVTGEVAHGPSAQILARGGAVLSQALERRAPLQIGQAVMTPGGALRCRYVIHSPTVPAPALLPSLENLKKATLAAVKCAEDNHLRSLAFPDMGLDGAEPARSRAARAMVSVLRNFDTTALERVLLVDANVEIVKAFETAIDALRD